MTQLELFDPDEAVVDDGNAWILAQARARAADMRSAEARRAICIRAIQRAARANGWTGPDADGHMIPPPTPPARDRRHPLPANRLSRPQRGAT